MDDMVLKAMVKWPNVPACTGWLGLDGRGDWYMRDDHTQSLGWFGAPGVPGVKGSRLQHDKLLAFIGRNYTCDELGQWYFQNGPQRVFVELTHAPWVWRLPPGHTAQVLSHTGLEATVASTVLDDGGCLYAVTALGLGLVHTQDVLAGAALLEAGHWPEPTEMARVDLPSHFGFVLSPALAASAKSPACTGQQPA